MELKRRLICLVFCDNTGAIALAKEPRFHKKTRHIKRCFNSIRENVQDGDIDISNSLPLALE